MNSKEGRSSASTLLMSNPIHNEATSSSGPPPAITRTASAASHDAGTSVASQQTRFSFYNAEDFVIASSPKSTKKYPKINPTRNNCYNSADEMKVAQVVVDTVEAHRESDDHYPVAKESDLDSVEILRSLQEHEQQRLDILAGPKKNFKTSNATPSCNNSHSSGTNATSTGNNYSVTNNTAGGSTEENSNPYEEAIKEALQLIRKHRTPRISDPQFSSTDANVAVVESSSSLPSSKGGSIGNRHSALHPIASNDCSENDPQRLEDEFYQLMIRTRSPPGTMSAPDTMRGASGMNQLEESFLQTPLSDAGGGGLGEAYQAEIEARRKQRQERMARYASRLAELKQEDGGDNIPVVDTARSLDSSVDYGSSGMVHRPTHPLDRESGLALSRSWEEDAVVAARSQEEFGPFVAPSNAGSAVSTLSNPTTVHRPEEDEVQRGVERVLLAILERASSQGRAEGMYAPRHPAISEPRKVLHDEGKSSSYSSDAHPPDDVLRRAMTDLLGPSSLAPPRNVGSVPEEEDPSASLHTQDDSHLFFSDVVSKSYPGGYTAGMRESASNGFATDRRPQPRATDVSVSSPEEPIAPIDTLPSPNIDENDDDEVNAYDYHDDDIVDDKLHDDDDFESEDDSGSYEDDGSSVDDDYFLDSESGKNKGVLGPLSKRSGGTTGVVLEDFSSASSASYDDETAEPSQATSILESLSAAVSRVTGIAKVDDMNHLERSARSDKYSRNDVESDDESSDESIDSHANELMRSLCAHLLPVGVDPSRQYLDEVPEWDESNPDEAGYRIVRLTSYQLRGVQKEFEQMVETLQRRSLILSPKVGVDDTAFELDLQAAEKLLDGEESKVKRTGVDVPLTHSSTLSSTLNAIPSKGDVANFSASPVIKKVDETECLACFPGVRPAGKGEMGELEYFSLPIIFKSHVTGFEPTKDMILEPGNVVAGQYLVEGVLGSAAFSTAYKCVDLNSEVDKDGCQDVVCLKVIKNTKDFFDQSLDEIKILELLRQTGKCHEKFIVEMKTFFYHREHLIIVTELLRQNLFEFGKYIMDSGEEPYFTLPRLSYIARQCLIALDFVHGMGLVHSDVKPENILLASYSRAQAKLIDFGSSCYLTDRQSSYIQSRSYRAPEVVLGLPYDGRIDIWSLGCVIAEMFTGEVTFQNDSVVSMLSRIEAICGPFPRHMIAQGRQSARFFTKCGLLFEKVVHENSENTDPTNSYSGDSSYDDDDESRRRVHIDIFQPKRTTLAARLGFATNLMDKFGSQIPLSPDEQRQATFCDLVRKLLTIDPEVRLTAAEALNHPAMLFAATLTEADVKYPSA